MINKFVIRTFLLVIPVMVLVQMVHVVHAQSTTTEATTTETITQPLVIECTVSKSSVQPDEEVAWIPKVISGDDSRNWYNIVTEPEAYHAWGTLISKGLSPAIEKYASSGIVRRDFAVFRTYTTNQIARVSCGSVTVRPFDLKSSDQKPDLVIDRAFFSWKGAGYYSKGGLCVDVKNIGTGGSFGTFTVDLLQDNYNLPVGGNRVPDPGQTVTACTKNYGKGSSSSLRVDVDKGNRIDEVDKTNNGGTFSISVPERPESSITLLNPNSGNFDQGDRINITWQSQGIEDKVSIYYIDIPYYGESSDFLIAKDVPNTGSYMWTVDTHRLSGNKSRINIVGTNTTDYLTQTAASADLLNFGSKYIPDITPRPPFPVAVQMYVAPVASPVVSTPNPVPEVIVADVTKNISISQTIDVPVDISHPISSPTLKTEKVIELSRDEVKQDVSSTSKIITVANSKPKTFVSRVWNFMRTLFGL